MQTMGNWDSYRDDLDALKSEFEKLIEARNDVMRRIKIAEEEEEQPQMKPTNEVQQWLSSVQAVETEVDELIKQASEEIERLHPGGFCTRTFNGMSSSYEMEDMVADKLQAVTNLIEEGAFLVAADEVPVVTTLIDEGAPEETLPEDVADDDQFTIVGTESMINEVLRCLKKEEDVGIIGVYGMGGVGKTTLLKQINKKLDLEMKNDFDVVIWVVVSRDLQLDKIQQQIGKKIGLFDNKVWKHKNFKQKASDIFKILKEKKFVLLMDDLWERVDLTAVGVPLPKPESSSKIVFTTRSLQICSLMEAGKLFKVTCLSDEEAWKLFRASVGDETLHAHPEVPEIARDVSRACYGLPLALVSFGRAMASKKSPQEWTDLLQVLSMSSNSGSDYELKESIYYNLKLSYDFLQNDMFKSCLLYCCLFPRNNEISKRELIDCWIGEGFLDDRLGAQSQGYYIIGVLLSTCLLEEGKDENGVKMHNWIHEMSWWIANDIHSGEKGNFFLCTIEAPESKKWENVTRISVMKNMTRNLIDAPKSPHLQTLFLCKNDLEMINSDFFQFLPCLRVLNLSNNFFLTKLPSGISNLVSLQHLDLSRTYLRELPNQLGDLKKLKCLNLEDTYGLRTIPKQLISKFSMLHVLRLRDCGFMLQSTEDSAKCNDAQLLIKELLCLKNLSMLSITFMKNSHALQRLLSSNRLQSCIQSLCLRDLSHPKSVKVSLTDLKHLNTLNILNCVQLEEVEVDFVGETQAIRKSPSRFYFLDKVTIKGCPKLWDLTWLILAPNLKSLEISDCFRMEEIINVGKLSPELMGNVIPFSKLKRLNLVRLPKLRSIYWRVLPFPDVKELTIAGCPMPPLPPHLLNKVNVTSACSEVREFEYRVSHVPDVDIVDNHDDITSESLRMRFWKLLGPSSISTLNSDTSNLGEISQLNYKTSSLLKEDDDDRDQVLKFISDDKISSGKAMERLLQKLLKEKLHIWLLQKVAEGGKGPSVLDQGGQGVLHFAAALGYDWALEPTVIAGASINFRDVNGWTALHWAAYCGRERTVASLLSLGAAPGALSDPTPKYPTGRTPADLAHGIGHKGIAGYLAEYDLSSHLSSLNLNKKGGEAAETTVSHRNPIPIGDWDSMKDSHLSSLNLNIHQVCRVQSFQKKQLKEFGDEKFGISEEKALSLLAVKKAQPVHAAATRIQNKFRSYKGRKDFLIIRQRIVKIQAHVRGHQVRKNYKKIIWSVGIVEKIILRWRRKGSGLRGFKSEALTEGSSMQVTLPKEDDYDFLKEGRKQKEERLQKALARVKSMVQYREARDQYRRLLNVVTEIQETKAVALNNAEETAEFEDDDLIDIEALLDDDTFMPSAS